MCRGTARPSGWEKIEKSIMKGSFLDSNTAKNGLLTKGLGNEVSSDFSTEQNSLGEKLFGQWLWLGESSCMYVHMYVHVCMYVCRNSYIIYNVVNYSCTYIHTCKLCKLCKFSTIQFNSLAMTNSDIYTDQLAPVASAVYYTRPVPTTTCTWLMY